MHVDHATWTWPAAVVTALALVGAFAALIPRNEYDGTGGVAVTTAVVLVGWLVTLQLSARETDPRIRRAMHAGFWLKLVASAAFYSLVFHGAGGDAGRYHRVGGEVARSLWAGDWGVLTERGVTGTAAMESLAGVLYAVTGPSAAAGFAIFALLSFFGAYLGYRGFVRALPDGSARLYARLVFLLPSMLFWPASLGKEAWMIAMLGLSAWGATRVLQGDRGIALLLVGIAGLGALRPHMAAMTVTALAAAPLIRSPPGDTVRRRRGRRVLLVTVLVAGTLATIAAQRTFGLASLSPDTITGFLDTLSEHTDTGGSAFSNVETINPLLTPVAFVSVLLRPFPFEAANLLMWLASAEALFVAALLLGRWRSLRHSLRLLRSNGYVAFATIYTVLFVLSYSFFNNLGLLVRERVQVLPVLFVLVAASSTRAHRARQASLSSAGHSTVPMTRPPTSRTR